MRPFDQLTWVKGLLAVSLIGSLGILACKAAKPNESSDISSDDPERAAKAMEKVSKYMPSQLEVKGLAIGDPVYIRIFKKERQLELWMKGAEKSSYQLVKTYSVAGMSGELGPKLKEGDFQAPEGFYATNKGLLHPLSRYHLAFNIGYPNAYDRAHERTGSFIMVHGGRVSAGCFAMTDPMIEEIYSLCAAALAGGQNEVPVHCFPFRMDAEQMESFASHSEIQFWQSLKPAYDQFESEKNPPQIDLVDRSYVVANSTKVED